MSFQHFDARSVLRPSVLDSQNSQNSQGWQSEARDSRGAVSLHASTPIQQKVPKMFPYSFPEEWRDGYARLCQTPPTILLPESRWRRLIDDGGRMLEEWGGQLSAMAWDTVAVWGCHPHAPDIRTDYKGVALSICGRRIAAVTETTIRVIGRDGVCTSIYRRPSPPGAVPVWGLNQTTDYRG